MAWYLDSKNVKKNPNEAANSRYEKYGNLAKIRLSLGSIAVRVAGMKMLSTASVTRFPLLKLRREKA